MAGILHVPGPIAVHLAVKNLSPAFNVGVNKAKFLSAASNLEAANFGSLVVLDDISASTHVFIKKEPSTIQYLLQSQENQDLCSIEEYHQRYTSPCPSTVKQTIEDKVKERGLVPAASFLPRMRSMKELKKMNPDYF